MSKTMWWGYLHANGTLQVKRWFGDHADYTTDCIGNPFVQRVVYPFTAETLADAERIAASRIRFPNTNFHTATRGELT